jgi:glycosyltransferase involved in cell wall biosynthesis
LKPKLTIITVNYNNREGLQKTISNVFNQTWKAFEYIVIDGGSTDGSLELLDSYGKKIDYWISELDKGVYNAMNKAIQKASGEYLLFLNSGDNFYGDEVLEKNQDLISNFDLIYFNLEVIEDTKTYIKEYPKILSFAYFVKDTLPHPATFIKKDLFQKVGFYKEDFKIVSDWKFFLDAVCKYKATYLYVDKTLSVFYRDGMSSKPENKNVIYSEKQQVLESDYKPFLQDLDDVLYYRDLVETLKKSKIIKWLVKFGFLNKF